MGIYTKLPAEMEEVDVIIAGGGTAGCIVAARLADADPNLSILVIEGGPNNHNVPTVVVPMFFLTHLMPGNKMALFYQGKKEKQLADREVIVPSGSVLGGGSSINLTMYARPQRVDFDSWKTPVEDLQNLEGIDAVELALRFVSPDGKRQDIAHRSNPEFQPEAIGETRFVKARRMVVVSCGAIGSPLLLERSGIGKPETLEAAGIPPVSSVPGVGHEYNYHQLLAYAYKTSLGPDETLDALVQGRVDLGELMKNNDKLLGWNAQDDAWSRDFRDVPTKPLMLMSLLNGFPSDPTNIPPGQYLGVSAFSPYPYSRGHVHITKPDLDSPINFETGFFSDPHDVDLKKHVWAYKKQREIVRRMEVYRGEVASSHPPFPAGSDAACGERDGPLTDVRDIKYTAEDDAILEQWLRKNVGSTWQSLGTCKMAAVNEMGVVDPMLSVYGVEGLKVADMSIVPENVGANTNSTALAIGEKAANIFIRELGLDLSEHACQTRRSPGFSKTG
ncbi:hypothetical protein DL764_004524 [Monosporascus ibericus]|uniref:Glucose-methanol-choline oxidoreductase N-terminal domain-containing protein n=1 Tax=Monosporascus ibericus TaxID=155417 RepID=A0A4Q4TC98_9PEZI|nr:hypothetical protein DL764_004524 [Monosporascus ibericus]